MSNQPEHLKKATKTASDSRVSKERTSKLATHLVEAGTAKGFSLQDIAEYVGLTGTDQIKNWIGRNGVAHHQITNTKRANVETVLRVWESPLPEPTTLPHVRLAYAGLEEGDKETFIREVLASSNAS